MLASKPDRKKTTFSLLIALIKTFTREKNFYVDRIILYVHQTTGENRRFYENFNKWTLKYRWKVFFRLAIKQRKTRVDGGKGRGKNFKTIFTRWKKHVDDMFPSHVMKFLSSDDVEKLVFVFLSEENRFSST